MALTVGDSVRGGGKPSAPMFVDEVPITFDDSYPTNGWPVTGTLAAKLPVGATILAVFVDDIELSGYQFQYDRTNDKLLVFTSNGAAPAALAELNNTSSALDGVNARLIVISK